MWVDVSGTRQKCNLFILSCIRQRSWIHILSQNVINI